MCSRIDSATEDSPPRGSTLVSGFMLVETSRCTTQLLCFALVPEDPRRGHDDQNSDDEREHRGIDRRMDQEETSCGRADDERDEDAARSAALGGSRAKPHQVTR